MTDRPILFSAPMVRALLASTKTQTRRVLRIPSRLDASRGYVDPGLGAGQYLKAPTATFWSSDEVVERIYPFCEIGDRLWVRETCKYDWTDAEWRYVADDLSVVTERGCHLDRPTPHRWPVGVVPSLFMPRWASRLTLTVTDVRVQRLREISEEDAKAEGVARLTMDEEGKFYPDDTHGTYRCGFIGTWNHLNGDKPSRDWDANPWIVAVSFTAERRNIDAKPTLATAGGAT